MELMRSVVDLDRPISIHGEQIAETLITRPVPSSLRPAAIAPSRDSHRRRTYRNTVQRDAFTRGITRRPIDRRRVSFSPSCLRYISGSAWLWEEVPE